MDRKISMLNSNRMHPGHTDNGRAIRKLVEVQTLMYQRLAALLCAAVPVRCEDAACTTDAWSISTLISRFDVLSQTMRR
jgi:hypothetical protein